MSGNVPRKAYVAQTTTPPALTYWDGNVPVPPISPPHVGGVSSTGVFSGLLVGLPQGAQVLVLAEGWAGGAHPVGSVSMTETPSALPQVEAGATLIQNQTGAYIKLAASGAITLHVSSNLALVLDPTTNRVNVTATGGLWVGGAQVTVP